MYSLSLFLYFCRLGGLRNYVLDLVMLLVEFKGDLVQFAPGWANLLLEDCLTHILDTTRFGIKKLPFLSFEMRYQVCLKLLLSVGDRDVCCPCGRNTNVCSFWLGYIETVRKGAQISSRCFPSAYNTRVRQYDYSPLNRYWKRRRRKLWYVETIATWNR